MMKHINRIDPNTIPKFAVLQGEMMSGENVLCQSGPLEIYSAQALWKLLTALEAIGR